MDHLYRSLAPISDGAWGEIDASAKGRLTTYLAARRLVDFHGPRGWTFSAVNLGRSLPVTETEPGGVAVRCRQVMPLVEYRVPFSLERSELEAFDRGATDISLEALDDAVEKISLAENSTVFHGYAPGGITGIVPASSHDPVVIGDDFELYPKHVARAVRVLLESGIAGPFALALSSEVWMTVVESTEHGGYPLFEHLKKAIGGGPIVWSPGVEGGVVISQRGGDFTFESGQDLSIGYLDHDRAQVTLYLEESFTFKVDEPDAAIALVLR